MADRWMFRKVKGSGSMGGQTAHQPRKMTPLGFSSTVNEYPLSAPLVMLHLRHVHNGLSRRPQYCKLPYLSSRGCWSRFHSGYLCHSHFTSTPRSVTVAQKNVDDEDDQKEGGRTMAAVREGSQQQGEVREKRNEKGPVERTWACIRTRYCSQARRVVRHVSIGKGAQRLARTPWEETLMPHPSSRPV
ncbi:hypothetical protein BJV78DRAFT_1248981 [Lactifluus subvellereus]|nr:hypothetical protein BJV78DRAFT_1248981 [Lactifluus subvellereus]